jgi:hypothetical protein
VFVEISADSGDLIEFFNAEYRHFFLSKPPAYMKKNRIHVKFQKLTAEVKNPRAWIKTRVCQILFFRHKRRYLYKDGSFADDFSTSSRRILKFFYKKLTTGVEEANLFLLSSVGEMLECSGLVRLHACAFDDGNTVVVFPGDSGFGKSTLAKEILLKTDFKILSDEMVLTDGSKYYPFPLRISLKEPYESDLHCVKEWSRNRHSTKWQLTVPPERVSVQGGPGKILLSAEMSRVHFFIRVMSGYGLAQMKEYFVRKDNLASLIGMLFQRLIVFTKLYSQVEKIPVGQRQSQKILNLLVKTTEY